MLQHLLLCSWSYIPAEEGQGHRAACAIPRQGQATVPSPKWNRQLKGCPTVSTGNNQGTKEHKREGMVPSCCRLWPLASISPTDQAALDKTQGTKT